MDVKDGWDAYSSALGLTNGQLQSRAASLIANGLVYRSDRGRLAFCTPLFGDFLRRSL